RYPPHGQPSEHDQRRATHERVSLPHFPRLHLRGASRLWCRALDRAMHHSLRICHAHQLGASQRGFLSKASVVMPRVAPVQKKPEVESTELSYRIDIREMTLVSPCEPVLRCLHSE